MTDNLHNVTTKELERRLYTTPNSEWALKLNIQEELNRRKQLSIKQQDISARRVVSRSRNNGNVAVLERPRHETYDKSMAFQAKTLSPVEALAARVRDIERTFGLKEYQTVGVHFLARNWLQPTKSSTMPYPGQILGDDPGLGKTVQFFATLNVCPEIRTVLYLTNKSLTLEVVEELRNKWAPKTDKAFMFFPIINNASMNDQQVSMTLTLTEPFNGQRVFITNYEALAAFPSLSRQHWDLLVCDESHRLRGGHMANPTQIWKNVKDLVWANSTDGVIPPVDYEVINGEEVPVYKPVRNADRCLFMTGSLINNTPLDIWSAVHIFDPIRFPDAKLFRRLFNQMKKEREQGNASIAMDLVIKALAPCMIRRQLQHVRDQMPEVTYIDHKCEMTSEQATVYAAARDEIKLLAENMSEEVFLKHALELYTRLRQLAIYPGHVDIKVWDYDPFTGEKLETFEWKTVTWKGNGKLDQVVNQIDTKLMEGEQVVVASSQYKDPVEWLHMHYHTMGRTDLGRSMNISAAIITGETPVEERRQLVEDFQQGRLRLLFCTAKAAGTGLNLQKSDDWPGGASHIMLIDEHYNPEVDRQMLGRILRINTNAPVFVHRFVLQGTGGPESTSIDHVVRTIQSTKKWWIDEVTNNSRFTVVSKQDLLDML